MKLAVVIPTYKYHIPFLIETLESIVRQTRIPDIVIIRASSCDEECSQILNNIRNNNWPFVLNILETTAVQFTGQNRNEAIDAVPQDVDIISNFDSDDIMHPRRLEFIEKMIENGADAVVHDYLGMNDLDSHLWNTDCNPEPIYKCLVKDVRCTTFYLSKFVDIRILVFLNEANNESRYSDGSLSFRKEYFNIVRYDADAKGYQDIIMTSNLHRLGCSVVLLQNKLTLYRQESGDNFLKKYMALSDEYRT